MTNQSLISNKDTNPEFELIAQVMLKERGDLSKVSRDPRIRHNAMELRIFVKENPEIRTLYHDYLADELQEKGLHIAERILTMAELQQQAMGCTTIDSEGNKVDVPADTRLVIELSKEISRLIAEGKQQNISAKSTVILASKEDAKEILEGFLKS